MYQEEEKVETPVTEEVSVEPKKEETPAPVKEEKKEEKPNNKKPPVKDPEENYDLKKADNLDDVVNEIETKRKALVVQYNKTRNISRIITFVVVIAVIGAIIMIFNDLMVLKIIGYSLAGATLVGMGIYYFLTKDKFPRASKEYIANVTTLINEYDFDDKRFTDLRVYPNKKLAKTDLEVDRVYKNAAEIGSRNFIRGKFDEHKFEISENVLYSAGPDRRNPRVVSFLGKYISLENSKKFEGRYIFNFKGNNPEKLIDQPNDLDDLKLVLEEGNLMGYAPNDKDLKDVFGPKFLSALKEIKVDDKLLNFVMVVWAGHTGIYLSYDDSVTVLPFEKEFNKEAQDKFKSDLVSALELATLKK